MPRVKHERRRGAPRMYQLKRTQVVLWLDENDLAWLDQVRGITKRATWCKEMVMRAIAARKAERLETGPEGKKVVHSTMSGTRNKRR